MSEGWDLNPDPLSVIETRGVCRGMNLLDAWNPILEDSLDSRLQSHHRKWAASARAHHLNVHRATLGPEQHQIAAVGLDGGADVVERLLEPDLIYGLIGFHAGRDRNWRCIGHL